MSMNEGVLCRMQCKLVDGSLKKMVAFARLLKKFVRQTMHLRSNNKVLACTYEYFSFPFCFFICEKGKSKVGPGQARRAT